MDLLAALNAMPDKALVIGELETADGDVCALGALGKVRGLYMSKIDPEDPPQVADAFDIAECLAQEIVYMNDEHFGDIVNGQWVAMTPELRWKKMRSWVAGQIRAAPAPAGCVT